MNSISECLDYLEDKSYLFKEYVDNLKDFYRISGQLKHLEIIQDSPENKDIGKIVILTKKAGITGVELARRLREEYKIETELSSFSYVLAMTSIMDTKEGFKRLEEALTRIDKDLKDERLNLTLPDFSNCIKQMEPWQAKAKAGVKVEFEKSLGLICQDEICLYPPGAPVVVPGEIVNEQVLETIEKALSAGIHVTGIRNGLISVVN
jgi:arginine/lysine/ornithine decarboxylase